MESEGIQAVWPSGLRRQLQALVRKGEGSNPSAVTFSHDCGLLNSRQYCRSQHCGGCWCSVGKRLLRNINLGYSRSCLHEKAHTLVRPHHIDNSTSHHRLGVLSLLYFLTLDFTAFDQLSSLYCKLHNVAVLVYH